MKQRHILIYISSLLLVSFPPARVYGDESSQTIGDDNNFPIQIINSQGITIHFEQTDKLEAAPNTNSPNSEPTEPKSIYSKYSGGLTPIQNSEPQISNLDGYTPKQNSLPQISTY